MAGEVLLDTNIVIAFFGSETAVCQRVAESDIIVTSTVLGELYFGARRSGQTASNLTRLDEFSASVAVLPCDGATSRYYGEIKDRLRAKGRPIPDNDIWIAAVALQYGLPLATRDEHFKHVESLELKSW
jgi:tRNA(fMet)-specific endonuclease VapC